jgi:hypothetical protein
MKNRVITRKRGVIPGCIPVGPDNHMAVDSLGRPWPEVAKLPSTVDAWLAELAKKSGSCKSNAGAPQTGALIGTAVALAPVSAQTLLRPSGRRLRPLANGAVLTIAAAPPLASLPAV